MTIEASAPIRLAAITVNPVAPLAHRFDAAAFREHVGAAVRTFRFRRAPPELCGPPAPAGCVGADARLGLEVSFARHEFSHVIT